MRETLFHQSLPNLINFTFNKFKQINYRLLQNCPRLVDIGFCSVCPAKRCGRILFGTHDIIIVSFRFELPNGRSVGVKANPSKSCFQVLEPVMKKNGFDIGDYSIHFVSYRIPRTLYTTHTLH